MSREVSYPVPYSKLRQLCLEEPGLNASERVFWWPLLVRTADNQEVKAAFSYSNAGLRFRKACKTFHLRKHSSEQPYSMAELFNLIVRMNQVAENSIPLVQRLFFILYSGVEQHHLCPLVLMDIFEELFKNSKFHLSISQLPLLAQTFVELLNETMPKTAAKLQNMKALEYRYLDQIFFEFFAKLLSINDILRIMDIYLLEGTRALFKYGMGLIFEQKDNVKNGKYNDGEEFWNFLLSRGGKIKHPFVFKRIHSFAFEEDLNKKVIRLKLFSLSSSSFRSAMMSAKRNIVSHSNNVGWTELIFDWAIEDKADKDEGKANLEEEEEEEEEDWDDDTTATVELVVNNPMLEEAAHGDSPVEVVPPKEVKNFSCCCL